MITVSIIIVLLIAGIWFYLSRMAPPDIPPPPKIDVISPAEAKRRLDAGENAVLLDVRTTEEYAEIHIPGSMFVSLNPVSTFAERIATSIPDKNTVVFAFCRSGQRSLSAAEIMTTNGYRSVYNMGGILDWPYEVVKKENAEAPAPAGAGR